jgi:hypothetical protein
MMRCLSHAADHAAVARATLLRRPRKVAEA